MKNLDDVAAAIVTLKECAETDFEIALVNKFVSKLLGNESVMVERTCPVCGKVFRTNRLNKKYCSAKCRRKFGNSRYAKNYATTFVCKNCGKEFQALKYLNRQFCSRECSAAYRFNKK